GGEQRGDAVGHARIGGGGAGRGGADARARQRPGARAGRERGHHGRRVVGAQTSRREAGQRRHRHVEARAREQRRRARQTRIVLALGRVAVHEEQGRGDAEGGAGPAIRRRPERLTNRGGRERVERGQRAVAQELDEERGGEDERDGVAGDRSGEDEGEGESGETAGYFRLTHFTRRHPLNMLT